MGGKIDQKLKVSIKEEDMGEKLFRIGCEKI